MPLSPQQAAKRVVRAGLSSAEELKSLWQDLPSAERPRDGETLLNLLRERELLTDFQAEWLLSGKGDSLRLGEYLLIDRIGDGGQGDVYRAKHRTMDRVVAIKMLRDAGEDADSQRRFDREVRTAARLSHPNIVVAHDAGKVGRQPYLVMEFIEGLDLQKHVRRQGPLAPAQAVDFVRQAGLGLQYAHDQGVVHRDIKPANLLLDRRGRVKILDMGLARWESPDADDRSLTGTHLGMGTLDFMAPEQAESARRAGPPADIYSLGATLWYLLTGRPLYEADTVFGRVIAHRERAIPSLRDRIPEASPELDAVFRRMVAKKPQARYASVAAVLQALEACPELAAAVTPAGPAIRSPELPRDESTPATLPTPPPVTALPIEPGGDPPTRDNSASGDQPDPGTDDRFQTTQLGGANGSDSEVGETPEIEDTTMHPPGGMMHTVSVGETMQTEDSFNAAGRETASGGHRPADSQRRGGSWLHHLDFHNDGQARQADSQRRGGSWLHRRREWQHRRRNAGPRPRALLVRLVIIVAVVPMLAMMAVRLQQVRVAKRSPSAQANLNRPLTSPQADPSRSTPTLRRSDGVSSQPVPEKPVPPPPARDDFDDLFGPAVPEPSLPQPSGTNVRRVADILGELRVTDDPGPITRLVHTYRQRGGDVQTLWEAAKQADERRSRAVGEERRIRDRVLYGVLLGLGEFSISEIPGPIRQPLLSRVANWFRDDPSSAVHGASGWLLRHWGQASLARRIEERPVPYKPGREWFRIVVEAGGQRFRQTYIVFDSGDYEIGSPPDEDSRGPDETRRRVRLTRPFAILDREITRAEFKASGIRVPTFTNADPSSEQAMVGLSWYDSVRFCRWWTNQAGMSAADQCYVDPDRIDAKVHPPDPAVGASGAPRNWPHDLTRRGFRLPTEAEWEIAARSGMVTPYSFGDMAEHLGQYGWFGGNSQGGPQVVRSLRPNPRGLFDVHGNAWEWCHDWYGPYPTGPTPLVDPRGPESGSARVNRGGSWFSGAAGCRSANRYGDRPSNRVTLFGLRVALVPFSEDPARAEPRGSR